MLLFPCSNLPSGTLLSLGWPWGGLGLVGMWWQGRGVRDPFRWGVDSQMYVVFPWTVIAGTSLVIVWDSHKVLHAPGRNDLNTAVRSLSYAYWSLNLFSECPPSSTCQQENGAGARGSHLHSGFLFTWPTTAHLPTAFCPPWTRLCSHSSLAEIVSPSHISSGHLISYFFDTKYWSQRKTA